MSVGTILFVHGTGVRLKTFRQSFSDAKRAANEVGITAVFQDCVWGDALGIEFEGLSLPDEPSSEQLARDGADFARWSWLFDDPLSELERLTIRDSTRRSAGPPGVKPEWLKRWETRLAYAPSYELDALLVRGGVREYWAPAWNKIVSADAARLAFERSSHELPEASQALARAIIAQLHVFATTEGHAGPSRHLRDALVERLIVDWHEDAQGLSDFLTNLLKRAATSMLRKHRKDLSDIAMAPVGDVLLYQARGATIRDFIRDKLAGCKPPIAVVAHSLGGIACFELLAEPNPPPVKWLVTLGSQSPLLYELGALGALKPPQPLPGGFPTWLNVYDRNDFLSYVAKRLFPDAIDMEVVSGQPFPASHGAYFSNEAVWKKLRDLGVP